MERSRLFTHVMPGQRKCVFLSTVLLGVLLGSFLFAYDAFAEDPIVKYLKHISVIFRHGEKTPTSSYPNDPYKEELFWPEGWGQLTNKGKKQMFQLGMTLRSQYGHFVGAYSMNTVRVDSSDHDRCHQSAGALLAALFPPEEHQVWNKELFWQPIPIHATPLSYDKMIVGSMPCPLYLNEKRITIEKLSAKYDEENSGLYNYLTEHTGKNITSLLDVESIYNILEIQKSGGKELPSWTKSVFPNKMEDIAALVLASFTYTPIMKRLRGDDTALLCTGPNTESLLHTIDREAAALCELFNANGPLLNDIATKLKSVATGSSKRKVSLYASHDLTIVSVRRALGFDDVTFKPGLGAALIVELHMVNNEPFVEINYIDNYETKALVTWEIPNCSSPCHLNNFLKAIASVIPSDWDTECQLR